MLLKDLLRPMGNKYLGIWIPYDAECHGFAGSRDEFLNTDIISRQFVKDFMYKDGMMIIHLNWGIPTDKEFKDIYTQKIEDDMHKAKWRVAERRSSAEIQIW